MYLPDGSRTDIVAQSAPRFPFHRPEPFIELLRVQRLGWIGCWKMPAVPRAPPRGARARSPRTSRRCVRPRATPRSPTTPCTPSGGWTRTAGRATSATRSCHERRESHLTPWAAKKPGRDYLQDEIRRRVALGPVRFTLELQIARPAMTSMTRAPQWPEDAPARRRRHDRATGLETERETGGDVLVFDPTRVVDGIELSDDPVLRFRHGGVLGVGGRTEPTADGVEVDGGRHP